MQDMLVKLYELPPEAALAAPRERTDPPRDGAG